VSEQTRRDLAAPEPDLTSEAIVARARALIPAIRKQQDEAERIGHHVPELDKKFTEAGFYRIFQPRRFGGYAFGMDTFWKVMLAVAEGQRHRRAPAAHHAGPEPERVPALPALLESGEPEPAAFPLPLPRFHEVPQCPVQVPERLLVAHLEFSPHHVSAGSDFFSAFHSLCNSAPEYQRPSASYQSMHLNVPFIVKATLPPGPVIRALLDTRER
jgi:hypothetical protein